MRVLFVVTMMRLGGRERVVGEISDGFLLSGSEAEIFTVWKRPSYFNVQSNVRYSVEQLAEKGDTKFNHTSGGKVKGAVAIMAKTFLPYAFFQKARLAELVKLINSRNYDAIVLTDLTISFAPVLKRKFPNLKLIGWVHMDYEPFINIQYKLYKKELRKAFIYLDKVIALTPNQAKGFQNLNPNVTSIPNPMPAVIKKTNNNRMKSEIKKMLVVSRIDVHHKGLDYLVEILKKLKDMKQDWVLEFVGGGPVAEIANFTKMIESAGVSKYVNLRGPLPGTEVSEAMNESDIFVMTSRYEGFPMSLGEAMANKLPIIAFDIDGVRNVDIHCNAIVTVPFGDVDGFAKALSSLIGDENQRLRMINSGIERAKELSIEKVVDTWKQVLAR